MNNDFKQKLQGREFLALKDEQRAILKWATGCGKSKMTIDLINYHLKDFSKSHPAKILFVVAERAHKQNWLDELNKWKINWSKAHIQRECYASLKKVDYCRYDFIVFDEAHHMFTEKRIELINNLRDNMLPGGHVYLLSATLSSSKIDIAEEIFGKFSISTVTLSDAIKHDILPDPKVYVIGMDLDDNRADQEITVVKGDNPIYVTWENRNKYKFKNVPHVIRCNQQQKYAWFTNEMEYWKERFKFSHQAFHQNKWVNLGSQRKRFLGELKTNAVFNLINKIRYKKRFVCFCASVNQAELFSNNATINSKRSSKYNQSIIDAFNKHYRNEIYAVGMITEGMNLNDIEAGIITQLDGKERLFIQKFGRSMRAEDPVSFIFYYKNTQDEVYMKNALENIDSKFIQYININQLNNIKL